MGRTISERDKIRRQARFPLPAVHGDIDAGSRIFRDIPVVGLHAARNMNKHVVVQALKSNRFLTCAFATRGQAAAQHVFGLSDKQTWDRLTCEMVVPHLNLTPSEVFHRFMTEVCRRHVDDHVWIRNAIHDGIGAIEQAKADGTPYCGIVFTDVRLESEAQAMRAMGGQVWHLKHETVIVDKARNGRLEHTGEMHLTESGILKKPGDVTIINNRRPDDLQEDIEILISDIFAKQAHKNRERATRARQTLPTQPVSHRINRPQEQGMDE